MYRISNKEAGDLFLAIAKDYLGTDYVIDEHNKEATNLLVTYASRNPYFTKAGYNLDKGLFLFGGVGTRKTTPMIIMNRLMQELKNPLAFRVSRVWDAASQYAEKGHTALSKYKIGHHFFDELGLTDKEEVPHFGAKLNVAEHLLHVRDLAFHSGYVTHFTSNLSGAALAKTYDARSFSRLKGMCNFIPVLGPDFRPLAAPKPQKIEMDIEPAKTYYLSDLDAVAPDLADGVRTAFNTGLINKIQPEKPTAENNFIIKAMKEFDEAHYLADLKKMLPFAKPSELKRLLHDAQKLNVNDEMTSPDVAALIREELDKRIKLSQMKESGNGYKDAFNV